MLCNKSDKRWLSNLIDSDKRETGFYNRNKLDRAEVILDNLYEVDRIFTGYMYQCHYKDANAFKLESLELYKKAWHERFDLFRVRSYSSGDRYAYPDPFVGKVGKYPQFPPTFDAIVDDYIEQETGKRPNISAESLIKPVEESFVDPLRRFREDD